VNLNATLLGQTIAMVIFVWFCMKFIWPPIIKALETRRRNIADGLAAAEQGQEKLSQAQTEADQLVAEARKQAGGILDQANQRATQLVESGKQEGQTQRERQVAAAVGDIEQETNRAREALSGQVSGLVVAGAEQLLGREIDEKAHADLLEKLIAEI